MVSSLLSTFLLFFLLRRKASFCGLIGMLMGLGIAMTTSNALSLALRTNPQYHQKTRSVDCHLRLAVRYNCTRRLEYRALSSDSISDPFQLELIHTPRFRLEDSSSTTGNRNEWHKARQLADLSYEYLGYLVRSFSGSLPHNHPSLNPTHIMSLSATAPTLAKAVGVTFGTYCLSDFLSNFIQVRRRARLQ